MSTFSKLSKSSIDCTLLQNYRGLRLTIVSLPKWSRKLQFHRVQQWFQLCWAIGGVVTIKVDNKLSVEPSISEQEFSIPNIQSLPTDSIQLIHWCTSPHLHNTINIWKSSTLTSFKISYKKDLWTLSL